MKAKPHSGMSKRIKVTGSGKLMFQRAGRRHLLEHKSSTRTRRLFPAGVISAADTKRVKKLLGR